MTELRVIDLPTPVASILDEMELPDTDGVAYQWLKPESASFAADLELPRLSPPRHRWMGSSLWLYEREMFLERSDSTRTFQRVIVAAFSDEPETLLFMPDLIAIRGGRTYKIPATSRLELQVRLSVFDLLRLLLFGEQDKAYEDVTRKLRQAWRNAASLSRDDATEPVL